VDHVLEVAVQEHIYPVILTLQYSWLAEYDELRGKHHVIFFKLGRLYLAVDIIGGSDDRPTNPSLVQSSSLAQMRQPKSSF